MTRECKVCGHPKRLLIENEILSGHMDIKEGAKELDVSSKFLWHHLQHHVKVERTVDGEFKIGEGEESLEPEELLKNIIWELNKRLYVLIETPVTHANEKTISTVVREIRELVVALTKIQGKLKEAPLVQFQQINVNMKKLTGFLVSNTCEKCREKVLSFLDEELQPIEVVET